MDDPELIRLSIGPLWQNPNVPTINENDETFPEGYPFCDDPGIVASTFPQEEEYKKQNAPIIMDDYRRDKTKPDVTWIHPNVGEVDPPTLRSMREGDEMLFEKPYIDDDPKNAWLYRLPEGPFMSVAQRHEWCNVPPRGVRQPLKVPVKYVRFSYVKEADLGWPVNMMTLQGLQKKHMDKGLDDINYNFLIAKDGLLCEARGFYVDTQRSPQEAHLKSDCLEVAFLGDFTDKPPPYPMLETAVEFLKYTTERFILSRDFKIIPYSKPPVLLE